MLLEDTIEPVVREIAEFLSRTGGHAGSVWDGYTADEDLIPFERVSDDLVEFVRSRHHEARLRIFNIRETDPDPKTIKFHPTIVLASDPKATASISIDNTGNDRASEPFIWEKEWRTGESESAAVEAGFSLESKTTISAGGEASQYKVSQEFKAVVSSAWTNQTGRTKDQTTGGRFPLVAGPESIVEGFLRWNEQTLQRRIECYGAYDFGIQMGRRHKPRKKGWRWASGSPVTWDSLEHLLAVAEKRGSVHHPRYQHYARMDVAPSLIESIRLKRRVHIDRLTPPFQGADGIKVVIKKLA